MNNPRNGQTIVNWYFEGEKKDTILLQRSCLEEKWSSLGKRGNNKEVCAGVGSIDVQMGVNNTKHVGGAKLVAISHALLP